MKLYTKTKFHMAASLFFLVIFTEGREWWNEIPNPVSSLVYFILFCWPT